MEQTSILQEKPDPNLIKEQTLDSFLSYLEYLTDNKTQFAGETAKFDSSTLLDSHKDKSILLVDKYLSCAVPSAQLEFLLESQGIMDYNADLDGFKHSICSNEGVISEVFSPNIHGEHFNPYKRFQSCCSASSRTCSKALDLVGLEIKVSSELSPSEVIKQDLSLIHI